MLCRKPPVTSVGGFGELVINYLEPQNKMFRVVSNLSYSVLFSGKKKFTLVVPFQTRSIKRP